MKTNLFRQSSLDRLSSPEQLDQMLTIIRPGSWMAMLGIGVILIATIAWGIFGHIPIRASCQGIITNSKADTSNSSETSNQREPKMYALLYVPLQDAEQLQPGMAVEVFPRGINAPEYGFINGRVESVSQYPASYEDIVKQLGTSQAQSYQGQVEPLEVKVSLLPDTDTPSGFQWSSGRGPGIKIRTGTLCQGSIIIKREHPINMLLTFTVHS